MFNNPLWSNSLKKQEFGGNAARFLCCNLQPADMFTVEVKAHRSCFGIHLKNIYFWF